MSEELQEALEEISMLIIANSGAARSAAFEALQAAKKKDFAQADQLMESAEKSLQTAHEAHRKLLQMDAKGQVDSVSILLCHAQDHLMGSALAGDLIKEMILLGPQVAYKKEEIAQVTQMPIAVIAAYDYAIGNVDNIMKQVDEIYPQ